jgi:hypothetical protein
MADKKSTGLPDETLWEVKGKLNADDEDAMTFAIGVVSGRVVLLFPHPAKWIGFGPDHAIEFGQAMILAAEKIKAGGEQ